MQVSPSLWSSLLSASQLEKEGFKATPAINSKKQILRYFYLLFFFLSMFQFISDLDFLFFFFLNHLYLYIVLLKPVFLLFLLTCSFPLSFFLLPSFSAFKYHHLFNSLTYYSLLVHIPPAISLFFLFVLFYRHFSCSQLWTVIWFSFDFIWDFLLVSRSLSFVFHLFFFFSCWLSSTYDLIWIFVAFLTATGVVSLKSCLQVNIKTVTL